MVPYPRTLANEQVSITSGEQTRGTINQLKVAEKTSVGDAIADPELWDFRGDAGRREMLALTLAGGGRGG